jgi:hypothetical protein
VRQAFEEAAGSEDRRMLDPGGDDVIAFVPVGEEYALERKVVRLASAAGKDNLVAGTPEHRCHVLARSFQGNRRRLGGPVPARRIAVTIRKVRPHGRRDGGIDRRAGVVVEINLPLRRCLMRSHPSLSR